jgi:hypothetical protein
MSCLRFIGLICLIGLSCLYGASAALAQQYGSPGLPEIGFNIGYSNISIGSSSIQDEGALRLEPSISIAPIKPVPQLRVGADLGVSMVLDNSSRTVASRNGTLIIVGSSDVPLWLLEPELSISWRQNFGNFFIEPGLAGGGVFGFFHIHNVSNTDVSYDADSNTGYGRVFLRAGSTAGLGTFGIQGSFAEGGQLNFGGNAKGDLQEWYVGVYGAFRF